MHKRCRRLSCCCYEIGSVYSTIAVRSRRVNVCLRARMICVRFEHVVRLGFLVRKKPGRTSSPSLKTWSLSRWLPCRYAVLGVTTV